MSCSCGCCNGTAHVPAAINRPGLDAIRYRAGDHASFLEAMLAMLSGKESAALDGLRTRDRNDPAIAWLDAWATVADVLTFYQERIANEGYLRTAVERRSIVELARLVGYDLRPGIAASLALAFEIEKGAGKTSLPKGTRAQSVPGPGESAQTFESSADLTARPEWNLLPVRTSEPVGDTPRETVLYLKGTNTGLREKDWVLQVVNGNTPKLLRVESLEVDVTGDRTRVAFQRLPPVGPRPTPRAAGFGLSNFLTALSATGTQTISGGVSTLSLLEADPKLQPRNPTRLTRRAAATFSGDSDQLSALVTGLRPKLTEAVLPGLGSFEIEVTSPPIQYFAVTEAKLFGYNAPKQARTVKTIVRGTPAVTETISTEYVEWPVPASHRARAIFLDTSYPEVKKGTRLLLTAPDEGIPPAGVPTPPTELLATAQDVDTGASLAEFGMSGKSTQVDIGQIWMPQRSTFQRLRQTTVYIASRQLEPARQPLDPFAVPVQGDRIELAGLLNELEPGRWLIVEGERVDVAPLTGVMAAELVMLSGIEHNATAPGDSLHTTLLLKEPLAYQYRRDTVRIHGNVAKATHGETRVEVLGSGDGSRPFQSFELRQFPLTYLAEPTGKGAAPALEVRANDLLWKESGSLAEPGPEDRRYLLRTSDEQKTSAIFGNGTNGARLPTGRENVKAVYRTGIGLAGNVKAGQVTLLASKPLGLKAVTNPIRASGGAGPDTVEQARSNTPLAVQALDRLVSVPDYAFFARSFAGIGKASATMLSRDARPLVHVTIAGAEDAPIDPPSDLYQNLVEAFRAVGDPSIGVELALRKAWFLIISASVRIRPEYLWESVYAQLRAALVDTLSFDRRQLGQPVFLSEVFGIMQRVPGVEMVDIDVFDAVASTAPPGEVTQLQLTAAKSAIPAELARFGDTGAVVPAELAYLNPALPETLIINRRESR